MDRSSRLIPARSSLPYSLEHQPLYPVTPAGRESVFTTLIKKLKEFYHLNAEVEVYHVPDDRVCYPCPLCGGVVFPSDNPGRENGEGQHRASQDSNPES